MKATLLAARECFPYRVGREPAANYGNHSADHGQTVPGEKRGISFCRLPLSPYVIPHDPASACCRNRY